MCQTLLFDSGFNRTRIIKVLNNFSKILSWIVCNMVRSGYASASFGTSTNGNYLRSSHCVWSRKTASELFRMKTDERCLECIYLYRNLFVCWNRWPLSKSSVWNTKQHRFQQTSRRRNPWPGCSRQSEQPIACSWQMVQGLCKPTWKVTRFWGPLQGIQRVL